MFCRPSLLGNLTVFLRVFGVSPLSRNVSRHLPKRSSLIEISFFITCKCLARTDNFSLAFVLVLFVSSSLFLATGKLVNVFTERIISSCRLRCSNSKLVKCPSKSLKRISFFILKRERSRFLLLHVTRSGPIDLRHWWRSLWINLLTIFAWISWNVLSIIYITIKKSISYQIISSSISFFHFKIAPQLSLTLYSPRFHKASSNDQMENQFSDTTIRTKWFNGSGHQKPISSY